MVLPSGLQIVLDPKVQAEQEEDEGVELKVKYNGAPIQSNAEYSIQFLALETALEYDSQSMADPFARIAEAYNYNEVTTSVGGNPEHEIIYINLVRPNTTEPLYDNSGADRDEHPRQPRVRQPQPVLGLHEPRPGWIPRFSERF